MKKLHLLLIISILTLAFCEKNEKYKFKVENWAEIELNLTTKDGSFVIEPRSTFKFMSSTEDYESFTYSYGSDLRARVDFLSNHPTRILMVVPYVYDFSILVAGQADSAYVTINGLSGKKKLPYTYGTNKKLTKYSIKVRPINSTGYSYTKVKVNDKIVDRYEHFLNEIGKLSGSVVY